VDPDSIPRFEASETDRARLRASIARVLALHPWVKAAYLYGSVARADRPARDIDVGLVGDPPGWGAEAAIAADLQAAFAAPVQFDVRLLRGADPVFLGSLMREGLVVYEADREARIRFATNALSVWLDFQPVWERMRVVPHRWAGE